LAPLLPDAIVYDIFAGTGSMGLESLSRGCHHVTFFESDRSAQDLLKKNITTLKVEPRAKLIPTDLFKWFTTAPAPTRKTDIVFLDPPYRFLTERAQDLKSLAEQIVSRHLSQTGLIIFRHDLADALALPNLHHTDVRDYGSMRIEFLHPTNNKDVSDM